MPRTPSAKKSLCQSLRRQKINLKRKEAMKAAVKKFRKLVAAKKTEEARKYLPQVYKVLDKMAKVELIKKNKANRLKSRLTKNLPR